MYSDEIKEEKEPIEIEIHPLSKWKRILVFLADYFLSFFLAFILLNVAVAPIFSLATHADARGENMRIAQNNSEKVLYGNKILFYENDIESNTNYTINFKHTFYRFLSYYVLDEEINLYGPKIENEVLYHYYNDIRETKSTFINLYNTQNQGHEYFIYDENKTTSFILKDEIKEELKIYYAYPDEPLSNLGNEYVENLVTFFTVIYKQILEDVAEKDLSYNNISYNEEKEKYQILLKEDHWVMTTCLLITYVISWSVIHLVIPLISKTGKTIGMRILKAERVDNKKLSTLKRLDVGLTSSYFFFLDMSYIFFLPLAFTSSGFIYVVSLPLIPLFSILSIFLVLISFVILLFNHFNRSLSDLASRSVQVNQDDLDAIYRYKGYYK